MYSETAFLQAISASFKNYQEFGARSTKKITPVHQFLADTLQLIFGNEYKLHYMGIKTKEKKVAGKYYPKDIDMTVTKANKPVLCVGFKFVTSNYKQNVNNYFETMMGETANIQANQGLPYAHIIVLRHKTPYYKKDRSVGRIETVNEKDLSKYLKLAFDTPQAHKPFAIGILLIIIDEATAETQVVKPENVLKKEFAELFENKMSVRNLFTEIEDYKKYLLTIENK
jgi:hypothetical protein